MTNHFSAWVERERKTEPFTPFLARMSAECRIGQLTLERLYRGGRVRRYAIAERLSARTGLPVACLLSDGRANGIRLRQHILDAISAGHSAPIEISRETDEPYPVVFGQIRRMLDAGIISRQSHGRYAITVRPGGEPMGRRKP